MLQKIILLLSLTFLFASCDTLKGYIQDSTQTSGQKKSVYNPRAHRNANRITPEYREKIKIIEQVDSWAYQQLLMDAVNKNDLNTVNKFVAYGANPNRGAKEFDNESVLNAVIRKGDKECLKMIRPRSEINYTCAPASYLPIVTAAQHSPEMFEYIISSYGADVNAYSTARYASGKVCALTGFINSNSSAVKHSKKQDVIKSFLTHGADPMCGSYTSWYAYILKSSEATTSNIALFAAKGAVLDMMISGHAETTVLGYFIEKKRYDVANQLLLSGANPNFCNTSGNEVYAPLHWAIEHNNLEMVKNLVDHGANVHCRAYWQCKPGQSALSYAMKKGYQPIVDYLLSKGAK